MIINIKLTNRRALNSTMFDERRAIFRDIQSVVLMVRHRGSNVGRKLELENKFAMKHSSTRNTS